MAYNYRSERHYIFTEDGLADVLRTRQAAAEMLKTAGACTMGKLYLVPRAGDSWSKMAIVDYLVEKGYLREITAGMNVAGQDRVFVEGKESL